MVKHTYKLIKALDASRIILGDRRGFGKDVEFYVQLHKDLKEDWARRHSVPVGEKRSEFTEGEHVLVKSDRCEGHRRAVILSVSGATSTLQERSYSVYIYDEGCLEDLDEHRITVLNPNRKQQVEPRTVIVRITGMVPARVVIDLAKQALKQDDAIILTQDSSWTPKSNRMAAKWLDNPDVKYLGLVIAKTNEDGSIYGDIYRKLRSKTQAQKSSTTAAQETKSQPESEIGEDGKPKKKEKKEKQYLSEFLVGESISMYNEELADSQLKVRAQGQRQAGNAQQPGPSKKVQPFDGKYNDTVLSNTKVSMDASGKLDPRMGKSLNGKPATDPTASEIFDSVLASASACSSTGSHSGSALSEKRNEHNVLGNHEKTGADSQSDADSNSNSGYEAFMLKQSKMVFDTSEDRGNKYGINVPGRLLVRGKAVRRPYTRLEEFRLNKNILKAMEALQISEPSDMHKLVAPNFIRGSDLIVIASDGGTQRGKNMRVLSYVLPILRLVYEKYEGMNRVDDQEPPEALLIVNSYNTGTNLESYINQLLNYSQDLPMRVKFLCKDNDAKSNHHSHQQRRMVPGGIGIFITTMNYLASVMETQDGSFLFEKLRFLMFEELDLYLKNYKERILTFIAAARENLKISYNSLPHQIVFSGSKWSMEMESLYKEMIDDRAPVVIINGPNQVLRYAKIKWEVHYVQQECNRLERLQDVLTDISNTIGTKRRIVITCSTSPIAEAVLKSIQIPANAIVSGTDSNSINETLNLWNNRKINVLVVSDEVMSSVKVDDATCLICFDSPELQGPGSRRPVAAERFGFLWSHIRNVEVEGAVAEDSESADLVAHFLLTGEEHNFHQLYRFASSMGGDTKFPPELKKLAEMIENTFQDVPMCTGTRIFGFCNNVDPESCPYRHNFTRQELSTSPSAPLTGEVEVRIIKCDNPSSYQAELMRHYVYENGKRLCNRSYLNEARRRKNELTRYFGDGKKDDDEERSTRKPLKSFKEGTWCAVHVREETEEYFARAKLEKVLQKDKHGEPATVRVYCLDTGMILNPAVSQLYELPVQFQEWSPLVVNLILCNLKPKRGEVEYRQINEKKAKTITMDKIFNAKIWLSIENTIWVNPMVEYHLDSTTGLPFRGDSVRITLINENVAEFNGAHLRELMDSVNKFPGVYQGITSPVELSGTSDEAMLIRQEFHQPGDDIRWAFVKKSQENKFDPAKIVTQFGYDPWLFFGVHDKYYSELKSLEKELHSCIEKYIDGEEDKRFVNYKDMFKDFYDVGVVVAAKERGDQTWMRGLIVDVNNVEHEVEADGGTRKEKRVEYDVFFVDYGDTCRMTTEELFPMPLKLAKRMPFQAIAFKLDHIQPLGGGEDWTAGETTAFLDIIVLDEMSIDVELVAYEDAEDTSPYPLQCRYYNAVAFHKDDDIGSLLVKKGTAEWKPGKENIVNQTKDKLLNFYNVSVDQALGLDADDDQDEVANDVYADFDINFEEDDLYDMFGVPRNGVKLPSFSVTAQVSQSGEVVGVQPLPALPAPEVTPAAVQNSVPAPCTPSTSRASTAPSNGLLHPKVLWRQTDQSFILSIQLADIVEYSLKIWDDKSTIQFETLDKSPNYGFQFRAYGKLEPQYSTHLTGQYMRITFGKKMKGVNWVRPLFSKQEKFMWLKEDLDYICDEDEVAAKIADEKEEDFQKWQRKMAEDDEKDDNSDIGSDDLFMGDEDDLLDDEEDEE